MLVSDGGTGLESPRGLPDETIVRAIRVIDRTTTVSLALLGLLILVRIVAGPAGLVDWLTALAVIVVGAGLLVQRRAQRILAPRERATGVSFTRLMQGLARSASPDALVTAIVDAPRGAGGRGRPTPSPPAGPPPTASSRPRSSPRASPCPHRARRCPSTCWCRTRGTPTPPTRRSRAARSRSGCSGACAAPTAPPPPSH